MGIQKLDLMKTYNNMPDFLVIGAGKSGTTSFNNYLEQHPEIFITPRKEPNFFAYETIKEEEIIDDPILLKHYRGSVTKLEDYLSLFDDAKGDQIKGEVSNMYLYDDGAILRIKKYVPDVKLIAILRQPAERLYSRYMHLVRENRAPENGFDDLLEKSSIWWKRPDLIKEGFYFQNLKKYFELFSPDKIKIFLYEDLRKGTAVKEAYEFLEVNADFEPDLEVVLNKSGIIKNKFFYNVISGNGPVLNPIKRLTPNFYTRLKSSVKLKKIQSEIQSKNLKRVPLTKELRSEITSNLYLNEIDKLETLIKRDLSSWKNL